MKQKLGKTILGLFIVAVVVALLTLITEGMIKSSPPVMERYPTNIDWLSYHNEKYAFELSYPSHLTHQESAPGIVEFFDATGKMTITILENPPSTLEKYLSYLTKNYNSVAEDLRVERLEIDDNPAAKLSFKYKEAPTQRQMQYVIHTSETVYHIFLDPYLSIHEEMLQTFKFAKASTSVSPPPPQPTVPANVPPPPVSKTNPTPPMPPASLPPPPPAAGFKTYSDSTYSFTLSYPARYTINKTHEDSDMGGGSTTWFRFKASETDFLVLEVFRPEPDGLYYPLTDEFHVRVKSRTPATVAGLPATLVEAEQYKVYNQNPDQPAYVPLEPPCPIVQAYWEKDGLWYFVYGSCGRGDNGKYTGVGKEMYEREEFDQMIASFKFL